MTGRAICGTRDRGVATAGRAVSQIRGGGLAAEGGR